MYERGREVVSTCCFSNKGDAAIGRKKNLPFTRPESNLKVEKQAGSISHQDR